MSFSFCIAYEIKNQLSETINKNPATPLKVDPQWIEDRFWTWVHCAALRIGRGEFFEVIGFLDYIRETALSPLKKKQLGIAPFGVRRIEQYSLEFSQKLKKTIAAHSKESCTSALQETIKLYRELRSDISSSEIMINEAAEVEATVYLSNL